MISSVPICSFRVLTRVYSTESKPYTSSTTVAVSTKAGSVLIAALSVHYHTRHCSPNTQAHMYILSGYKATLLCSRNSTACTSVTCTAELERCICLNRHLAVRQPSEHSKELLFACKVHQRDWKFPRIALNQGARSLFSPVLQGNFHRLSISAFPQFLSYTHKSL